MTQYSLVPHYHGGKERREKVGSDGYARSSLYGVYIVGRIYRAGYGMRQCDVRHVVGSAEMFSRAIPPHTFSPRRRDV